MKWRGLEEQQRNPDAGLSLRQRLDERRELMRQYVPAASQEVNRRAVEELRQSGIAQRILQAGQAAPDFELPDHNGNPIALAFLLARGPVIAVFFRGRWCPFCVAQLEALQECLPQIQSAGASLVAISPQTVKQCFFMRDQHKLAYPLLSDSGNRVARQFGLAYPVSAEQRTLYASTFVNLPFINGDPSWELPLPATYVIGGDGKIAYASADPDYTVRPEPGEALKNL